MKYILVLLLLVFATSMNGKNIYSIIGLIKNKNDNPIEGATIRVLSNDSIFLSGTISSNKGVLSLEVDVSKCIIEITNLGYLKQYIEINIDSSRNKYDIGTIILQENSINLQEIIVVGKAAAIQARGDTLEYNINSYSLPEQASVKELLERLPNVNVTEKGQIIVHGNEVKKILIDGKDFFLSDAAIAIKSLPGKIVNKVQVIEQSSDATRLTGFDNGDKETVINLTVKEDMKIGFITQANLGSGYSIKEKDVKYNGNAYANIMRKQDFFNIRLENSNTPIESISGETHIGRIGTTMYKEINKSFKLTGNAVYNSMRTKTNTCIDRRTILSPNTSLYEDNSLVSDQKYRNFSFDIKAEWKPNERNSVIIQTDISHTRNKEENQKTFGSYNTSLDTLYNGKAITYNNSNDYSIGLNIDYIHRMRKIGRFFSTSIVGRFGNKYNQEVYNWNQRIYENNIFDRDSMVFQKGINNNFSNQIQSNLSYVEPINKKLFIQIAYLIRVSNNLLTKETYNVVDNGQEDELALLPPQSPMTTQESINQRFTFNLRYAYKKLDCTIGMNIDLDNSKNGTYRYLDRMDIQTILPIRERLVNALLDSLISAVRQKVMNYSPILNAKYRFNKNNTLSFDYYGTMISPTAIQLQDYTDVSNPTNRIQGNPNLKSQFSNIGSIYFIGSNPEQQSYYSFGLLGNYTTNTINPASIIDIETGDRITTYNNINGNWNINLRSSFYSPIMQTKFTIGNTLEVGYRKKQEFVNSEINTMNGFTFEEQPNLSYYSDSFDVRVRGFLKYVSSKNSRILNSSIKILDWGADLSVSYLLPYKIRISSVCRWSIKKGYSENKSFRETIVDASLEKKVFSKKYGTGSIQLSGFDLLQNRKQLFRNIGVNYIQNTVSTTLGSYFLCSFIYSFDIFHSK